jgi:UDP-3-O-acyl-N-acetylglucosamine deacetylase
MVFFQIRYKPTQQILEIDYTVPTLQREENSNVSPIEQTEHANEKVKCSTFGLRSSTVPLKTNYLIGLYRGCK